MSQLNKIYKNDEKLKNTDDKFDFKLRIFFNKCKRVELSSYANMKEASFMLAKRALFHFYDNQYENIIIDKFRVDMKKFFEDSEWKRFNLTKKQFIHNDNVIVANSNLSLTECFQKLCVDLNDIQKELKSDYHDLNHMRKILIRACRSHSILLIELHDSSSNFSDLINSFYFNIINFESINKKNNTYLQNIDIIDCTHDHNFIDKEYHREFKSINNRDNRKFLINSRSRDRFSIRVSKKCFVCDKFNCWSTNHIEKKRDNFKKRSANRNLILKSRQRFERRLKQFIIEFEDNQDEDFIAQFFEKLNIDIDISFDNISISKFVIKFDSESESFLIVVDSIENSKTITAIIIMLADKTFKHKLISMNNITASANSIFYIYNVLIAFRYDDRKFKDILIDHDTVDFSSKSIEQFTILQRISKTTLILNKKRIISFNIDIDEILFIDTVNLNIFVNVITFHIVLVTLFFSFESNKKISNSNLHELEISNAKRQHDSRSSNRSESISIDKWSSNQFKDRASLHDKVSSNQFEERTSFDDSSIRSYISSLKHFCAVISSEIFRSKFLLFHRDRMASFSSTFWSFLESTFANDSWSIWSSNKFSSDRVSYQVLSSLSNSRKIFESI